MTPDPQVKPIDEEPYVLLPNGMDFANWGKEEEVLYNQKLRQKAKMEFYQLAFEFLYGHKISGDYYEFGCHKVRTLRMALTEARRKNFTDMNFYAFDSFEGLPDLGDGNEKQNPTYHQGTLTTSEEELMDIVREHGLYTDKVQTIKGFYEDTLTNELKKDFMDKNSKISIVTLDCSFFESFTCAFEFIEDLLQDGSILYIDDYRVTYRGNPEEGAPKAFKNFAAKSKFKFEEFVNIGWFGKSFFAYS